MAVYFEPQRRPWYGGLLEMGLGMAMKGMFERDAAARQDKAFRQQAASAADIMQERPGLPEPGAEEGWGPRAGDGMFTTAQKAAADNARFYRNQAGQQGFSNVWADTAGRPTGGATPENAFRALRQFGGGNQEQAQKMMQLAYGDALKTHNDLARGDAISGRVGPMPKFDDRQAMADYMGRGAVYMDPSKFNTLSDYGRHITPHQSFKEVDLGDRKEVLSFDPWSGNTTSQYSGQVGYSPTNKTSLSVANMNQAGANQRAVAERAFREKQNELDRQSRQEIAGMRNKDPFSNWGESPTVVEPTDYKDKARRDWAQQLIRSGIPHAQLDSMLRKVMAENNVTWEQAVDMAMGGQNQ